MVKLVMFINGNPVTGNPLKVILETENFKVPAKVPLATVGNKPIRPTSIPGSSPAAITEWNAYTVLFLDYKHRVDDSKLAYRKQFTDFALKLSTSFIIVDSVTLQPSGAYTFLKAAERLMAKNTLPIADPINFICFKNF